MPYVTPFSSSRINLIDYIPFSDPLAVRLDGYDSLFFQNVQKYVLIYIPLCLLSFFIFRKLFFLIINSPYSILLRNYSFGAYLLELLVFNNISSFWFLALRNFKMLYSTEGWFKFVQASFVIGFWVILMASISLYFVY